MVHVRATSSARRFRLPYMWPRGCGLQQLRVPHRLAHDFVEHPRRRPPPPRLPAHAGGILRPSRQLCRAPAVWLAVGRGGEARCRKACRSRARDGDIAVVHHRTLGAAPHQCPLSPPVLPLPPPTTPSSPVMGPSSIADGHIRAPAGVDSGGRDGHRPYLNLNTQRRSLIEAAARRSTFRHWGRAGEAAMTMLEVPSIFYEPL